MPSTSFHTRPSSSLSKVFFPFQCLYHGPQGLQFAGCLVAPLAVRRGSPWFRRPVFPACLHWGTSCSIGGKQNRGGSAVFDRGRSPETATRTAKPTEP